MVLQKILFLKLLRPSKYLALKATVTDHTLCQKCRLSEKCNEIFKLLSNPPISMVFTEFVYGNPYQRLIELH